MRIGYIGLGSQGAGIAEMIAKSSHELVVWARRPGVVDPYVQLGASVADNPRHLAQQCDIVGTCLMADADVISLAEDQAMLASMRPGTVFVNQATISPETARRLGELGRANGIRIVDAPVSGSSAAARNQTLLILASGDDDAIDAAQPMFETYGNVVRCGVLGAGQMAKLINNSLFYANAELVHQAIELARSFGLSAELMRAVLNAGSGGSFAVGAEPFMFDAAAAGHIAHLAKKDVGLLAAQIEEDAPDHTELRLVAEKLTRSIEALAQG